ncbi:MAG: NAD(P)-dependent alcohol dehydrogenase [Candidatus Dadabacteria bacterium]
MKNTAAVLYAPGVVRLEERPIPRPGPYDVLVEVKAVGVCGSDVHYYEHGRIGHFIVREPLVLGHECSGIIVDVGEKVSRRRIGERVAIEPGVPCGRCRECRSGYYNLCKEVRFFGTPPVDGAFQRYVLIHEDFAFPIPEGISDETAALIEPLSVGLWACRKACLRGGDTVLITGAGPIGLLTLAVARALGAAKTIVTDVNRARLEHAKQLGATLVWNVAESPLTEAGIEVDAFIECSGQQSALIDGLRALRPAGRAIIVGMSPNEDATIPLALLQNREIILTGVFRYANTFADAVAMVAAGRIRPETIISARYTLEEIERALQMAREDPSKIKAIVLPQP